MNESKSKFDKVLSSKDVFVIAFGAMIGWGWIVMPENGSDMVEALVQ